MKIKKINLLAVFILFLVAVLPAMAQKKASDSAASEEQIKEKIKEKLEKVVDKNLEKVKGAIKEKLGEKIYGYAGTIKAIKEKTLTLETKFGEQKVSVDLQAVILKIKKGQKKQNLKFKNLEKNDFILAMGKKNKESLLLGKRIIVIDSPSTPAARKILKGKVSEIDDKKITFGKNKESQTISITKTTKLKIAGLKKATVEKIQIGDQLYSIVVLDKKSKIDQVKTVLIVPGKANPAAEENEIGATPSASPKKSPKN